MFRIQEAPDQAPALVPVQVLVDQEVPAEALEAPPAEEIPVLDEPVLAKQALVRAAPAKAASLVPAKAALAAMDLFLD